MRHASPSLTFDYSPNRTFDRDGRLRVASSILSAAQVDGYLGCEIPGAAALGLDPNREYKLWRHPDELERAAPSFNGLQVLRRHTPVDAEDHRPDDTVGAAGSSASFAFPYLRNSLTIWTADAIRRIQDGSQRQISCAYSYDPEVKAGVTPQGQRYDLIMRRIEGNHIALVEAGRVGPMAAVGDGRLVPAHLAPFLNRLRAPSHSRR